MVAFEFNSETGKIFNVLKTFNELEEPTVEISKEASEVNGITMEMVKGHKIDDQKVRDFVSEAVIILAHNAKFDRHFVEKRFPWDLLGKVYMTFAFVLSQPILSFIYP